jgi:hypothetical protein
VVNDLTTYELALDMPRAGPLTGLIASLLLLRGFNKGKMRV